MRSQLLRVASVLALAGTLAVGALAVGPAPTASAHAGLIGTTPEGGSSLDAEPTELTFSFSEPVGNAAVVLAAPDGSAVTVSDVRAVDATVTAKVGQAGQKGTYSASYRVVSADGHPIEGTISYEVTTGKEVTPAPPPNETSDEGSFVHRHRSHLVWGILAVGIAIVLLLEPLRRRDDADDA